MYWVISDQMEYGTSTNDRAMAFRMRDSLIANGATDAMIECETEIDGRKLLYSVN